MDQTRAQKGLHRDSAVNVDVLEAASCELVEDVRGSAGHLFDYGTANAGEIQRMVAQHDDLFTAVGPFRKGKHRVEGFAADYDGVNRRDKFIVTVRLAATGWKKIEFSVGARNETVDTGSDEYGRDHPLTSGG